VDGQPTQCQDPIVVSDIADEAVRGLAEDDVPTFVIGLGAGLFNLHQIAESGGTGQAYLIEDGDAAVQFRDAITSIATTPLSCEFDLPDQLDPTLQVDPNAVQVVFYPLDGDPEELPRHATGATCVYSPYGGWYFDDASNPKTIHICPCNCNRLGAGRLEVRFGCAPRVFEIS
jgi:hypothetical protein